MRIAITGGTGFVGRHLATALLEDGHEVVLIARSATGLPDGFQDSEAVSAAPASVTDREALESAFEHCDAVAHLAGVNMERDAATYEAVHVRGTEHAVAAAAAAGADRFVLSSFLRARPDCGSGYHESKWAAERIVRESDLDATVLKIGVTYGRGDHMVSHISRAVATLPFFALVGLEETRLRPLAVADLVEVLAAALTTVRLADTTAAVTGPEEVTLADAVGRIGDVLDRDPWLVPVPVVVHALLARLQERTLETPLTSRAQVRILSEDVVDPAPTAVCEPLPPELEPDRPFTRERIAAALPERRTFGRADLRW